MSKCYDIAIIGSGIGGSILATILAKQGLKVVVFEGSQHPKFAIGESMILESSEVFRQLAETYEIPEIAYFSAEYFRSLIGTTHGVKRHFSYMYHTEGKEEDPSELLMANIPKEPYGHEMHIYRQDCDYFYCSLAIKYGADVFQNAKIKDVEISDKEVEIILDNHENYQAKYIVDASGFKSLLANKFNLRHFDLETHSRAIFTHAINVPSFHRVGETREKYGVPYSLHEGTLHHVFKGGWLWVIPFDNHKESTNHLCSVGLMLDPRVFPEKSELSAEEEFFDFIKRFPGIFKQLKTCKSVRGWTRTGRIQYSSKSIVGKRYCLLGHAAGFVDPLFSKGLYITLTSIHALVPKLLNAVKHDNYSVTPFKRYEEMVLSFLRSNDRLVSDAYKSFQNFKTWRYYAVVWVLGAYLEYLKLAMLRWESHYYNDIGKMYSFNSPLHLRLIGGGYKEFNKLEEAVSQVLNSIDYSSDKEVSLKAEEIKTLLEESKWMPFSIKRYIKENHLNSNQYNFTFFKNKGGILGIPSYRKHFFKDLPFFWLIREFAREKKKYSKKKIELNKREGYQEFDQFVHLGEVL